MSIIVFREDSEERIKELATEMGWADVRVADGCVKRLWQASQALKATAASGTKICQWCLQADQHERLLLALVASRFVAQVGVDLYEIRGNKNEIKRISKARTQRKKAAQKRWQKDHERKPRKPRDTTDSEECEPHKQDDAARNPLNPGLDVYLDPGVDAGMSSGNTDHSASGSPAADDGPTYEPVDAEPLIDPVDEAMRDDPPGDVTLFACRDSDIAPTTRKKAPRKAGPTVAEGTPTSRVWNAYAEAYRARYQQDPVRNKKSLGQCKYLVERLGAEGAVKVVRFYLTHSGRFYSQVLHQLGPCLKDAEALHTQMLAGHRVTATEAQNRDRQAGNMQAFANVMRRLDEEDRT